MILFIFQMVLEQSYGLYKCKLATFCEQRFFYITPQSATGSKANTLQDDSSDTSSNTENEAAEEADIQEEDVEDKGPVSPFASPEELAE